MWLLLSFFCLLCPALAREITTELTGAWTGFWSKNGTSPLYDHYAAVVKSTSTANVFSLVLSCRSGCGWTSGVGTITIEPNTGKYMASLVLQPDGTALTGELILDSQECGWTDDGMGGPRANPHTPMCDVIMWDNNSSWVKLQDIEKVHLVFMNHLDVGYNGIPVTGFINNILNIYFHEYFPRAISVYNTLQTLQQNASIVYTTHPWLVKLYLDCPKDSFVLAGITLQCPTSEEVEQFKEAVKEGIITWHRGPFNVQPGNYEPSLFEYGLSIASELDTLFGFEEKITLSQRDVPGMTIGAVPLLQKNNVQAISIGVNGGTCPVHLPGVFFWKEPVSGAQVLALIHSGGYPNNPGSSASDAGGLSRRDCHTIRGFRTALCFAFRTDNSGPPEDASEVLNNFDVVRSQFPGATVVASTFDAFVQELLAWSGKEGKGQIPVVFGEIGDIWMQGIASDPRKMAEYRAIARNRAQCINSGQCKVNDPVMRNSSFYLVKPGEHTWGLPSLGSDSNVNWANKDFNHARQGSSNYALCEAAWSEQRMFNTWALQAMADTPAAKAAEQELLEMKRFVTPDLRYYQRVTDHAAEMECAGTRFAFDGKYGAISRLETPSGTVWLQNNTLGLGRLVYTTFNDSTYSLDDECNGVLGGKPGASAAGAVGADWQTQMVSLWMKNMNQTTCSLVVMQTMAQEATELYGGVKTMWTVFNLTTVSPQQVKISIEHNWFDKTPTRIGESFMFHFQPTQRDGFMWHMDKLGTPVSPMDVVDGGSPSQHAVWSGFVFHNDTTTRTPQKLFNPTTNQPVPLKPKRRAVASQPVSYFQVESLDAPLVSPVTTTKQATPLTSDVSLLTGDMVGIAVNLENQVWNTNYIFYYPFLQNSDNDKQKFRFMVTICDGCEQ